MFITPELQNAGLGKEFEIDPEIVAQLEEEAARQQLHDEAEAAIEEDQQDITKQNYILRLDKKTLVQSDEEFMRCLQQGVSMRSVGYRHALHLLAEADAAHRKKIAKRKARKVTKASRKRNRS